MSKLDLQSAYIQHQIFSDFFETQKPKTDHFDLKNEKYKKYLRCDINSKHDISTLYQLC